jgi:hypothetical protein
MYYMKIQNKAKVLYLDIEPHYKFEYNESDGSVIIKSFSHRNKGKELTISKNKGGYLQVKLNGRYRLLHQIISEIYLGKRPVELVTNHIDGNKLNNRYGNLEYITRADNIRHAVKLGLHVCIDPSRSGRFKDGRAVKERLKEYKHEWYIENKNKVKC